jgi:DNA-binding transcriptional ArsR family regulator
MKPKLFGQAVTTEDIARAPAESGPTALVRLCGALIGTALGDRIGTFTLPEITERIHVPDGGIDARYTAPDHLTVTETGGLVGPGRTVFQFKYRDTTRMPRSRLVAELIRSVRDDLARSSPECDRYVLMTNVDLIPSQRKALSEAIAGRLPGLGTPPIIWGAAELALQLNEAPHLRNLFFADGSLCTLDFAAEELKSAYRSVGCPAFRGRGAELEAIGSFVADAEARLLKVFGPRHVGKTRLVIEALSDRGGLVVWSGTPVAATLELFRDLDAEDRDVVLVVDRCDPTAAARLAEYANERRRLKTIVIVAGASTGSGLGQARVLNVTPLSEDDSLRLVQEVAPGLSFGQVSWIAEVAGGLPGLLLYASALVREAGVSTEEPSSSVRVRLASLVAESHLRDLDPSLRSALTVVALLPVLGVAAEAARELDAVSQALGLSGDTVQQHLPALRQAGLVQDRGRFVEVVPPLLGEHLVSEQLGRLERLLVDLELDLLDHPGAFLRFLERVRDIDRPEVRSTVAGLLSRSGWFPDLASLVRNARRLRILAPSAPREALQCLERILSEVSVERLSAELTSDARRAVVNILEELTLRVETFEGAVKLLLALAEAENETWGNNATGIFIELFHWGHPQVPAPLKLRGRILRDLARTPSTVRRALVARTCGEAFRSRAVSLQRGIGPTIPEPRYRPTREDILDYGLAALEVIEMLSRDPEESVREVARAAAVHAFRPCVHAGLLPEALHELACRAFGVIEQAGRDAPGARERAGVVTALDLLIDDLEAGPESSSLPSGPCRCEALDRAQRLAVELTETTLLDRLWQWVGPGSHRADLTWLNTPVEALARVDAVAAALTADPATLRAHLAWLTGNEAVHRHHLFRRLGEIDDAGRPWAVIRDDPTGGHWAEACAAYCVGRASKDGAWVRRELDGMVTDPRLLRGVVLASSWLLPGETNLARLVRIAGSESMRRVDVAREVALGAPWREMAPPEAERLLRALDDGTAQVREALLQPILVWIQAHRDLGQSLRELAWSFLETVGPTIRREGPHTWDSLAATLGADEPDRLGAMLERTVQDLLRRGESLSLAHDLPLSWSTLKKKDPRGALEIVLHAARLPNAWSIADELPGLVDPARDRGHVLRWLKQGGASGVRFLAGSLDPDRPGFWQLVPDLILTFPDEETGETLVDRLHTGSWSGSVTGMIDRRLGEARKLQQHGEAHVRAWAQRAVTSLEAWRRREARADQEEWIWDYRIHRADLETILRKPDSPERLWAIGRLLEDAPERRVRELLTPAEILAVLPSLPHLDRATRAKWETWARHHGESSQRD